MVRATVVGLTLALAAAGGRPAVRAQAPVPALESRPPGRPEVAQHRPRQHRRAHRRLRRRAGAGRAGRHLRRHRDRRRLRRAPTRGPPGSRSSTTSTACSSIGDIAVAPSNPNMVWVGTGEANNRQSSPGATASTSRPTPARRWTHMGLADTQHIGRIVIHPANPDVVYVAALGHLWGPNRRARRVQDDRRRAGPGRRCSFVDENTGATDLVMDPRGPADAVSPRRTSGGARRGASTAAGRAAGSTRRTDGGTTWTKLVKRAAGGRHGPHRPRRLRPRRPDRVREHRGDTGTDERRVPEPRPRRHLGADERRCNCVRCTSARSASTRRTRSASTCTARRSTSPSTAGGPSTTSCGGGVHPRHHAMWIDPADPNHVIGRQRRRGDDLVGPRRDLEVRRQPALGQFYEISADLRDPYTSAAGCRTTAPGASRAPPATPTGSPTTTSTTSAGATASTRASTRRPERRLHRVAERALQRFDIATAGAAGRRAPPGDEAGRGDGSPTAGTGTPRWRCRGSTPSRLLRREPVCCGPPTAASAGRRSAPT